MEKESFCIIDPLYAQLYNKYNPPDGESLLGEIYFYTTLYPTPEEAVSQAYTYLKRNLKTARNETDRGYIFNNYTRLTIGTFIEE